MGSFVILPLKNRLQNQNLCKKHNEKLLCLEKNSGRKLLGQWQLRRSSIKAEQWLKVDFLKSSEGHKQMVLIQC
jgi:hypothetical protein